MKNDKEIFEKAYENIGAVWTETRPPEELVKLIESGRLKPCKVIDVGCGEGFYSTYLASKGFEVVGIDLSERAIEHAKQNSRKQELKIKFMAMDVSDLGKLDEKFDLQRLRKWLRLRIIKRSTSGLPEETFLFKPEILPSCEI